MSIVNSKLLSTKRPKFLLEYSALDTIPVMMGLAHFAFQVLLFSFFAKLSWYALIPLGFFYSYCIAWNIESVAHNFTHNNYFKSPILNRAFSLIESLAIGFSQQFYKTVHRRHHIGNSDRPNEKGETRDLFSIYRNGKDGQPESAWTYCLFGFFRGSDLIYKEMGRGGREADVRWAKFEDYMHYGWFMILGIWQPQFLLYFLPFYYLGHVCSMIVGYYEHFQANPDLPIAWGVSTYGKIYNFLWLNNGYHAEHHYRPRVHWSQMRNLNKIVMQNDDAKEIHIIKYSHLLGFLGAAQK